MAYLASTKLYELCCNVEGEVAKEDRKAEKARQVEEEEAIEKTEGGEETGMKGEEMRAEAVEGEAIQD